MENRTVEIALTGFHELVNSDFIKFLLGHYAIDDSAFSRMKKYDFRDWVHCQPFFLLKDTHEVYTPAYTLSRLIFLRGNEEIAKLFFLLFCCSSSTSLYHKMIRRYFNSCRAVDDSRRLSDLDVRNFNQEDYEALVSGRILERVGIYNIDEFISKIVPKDSYEYSNVRQGVLQMCLTAGYHYATDINIMPNNPEFYTIRENLPIILAGSQYVATVTGKDFYDAMREIINHLKFSWPFDRLINICTNNYEAEKLRIEKDKLQSQINAIEENIRKAATVDEIMVQSFDWPVSDDEIEKRINKCNSSESRELLYKLESKLGRRLSFLEYISNKNSLDDDVLSFIAENHVIFSEDELSCTITVENLIDTITEHKKFLERFIECLFYNKEILWSNKSLCDWYDPKYYSLETKLKEVESMFSTRFDMSVISSEDDIRKAVINKYPDIREFVGTIRDTLDVPEEEITLSADIFNDIGADSISIFDLEDKLEERFGFTLSSETFYNNSTVRGIILGIIGKIHEQNSLL